MARRQILKFTDWSLIGFNSLIGKSEGNNNPKKNCQRAGVEKAD
jgi:hypothetical protein